MNTRELLQLGYGCGLKTVDECYDNVIRHYDLLFIIDNFNKEIQFLLDDMKSNGLIVNNAIVDMTIDEAAKLLNYTLIDHEEYTQDNNNDMLEDFEVNF